jgi:hypothetical protein
MPFGHLDEAQERLRAIEVVSFDAFHRGIALNPGHRVHARSSVNVTTADSVADVELLVVQGRDREPTAIETLRVLGPSPREGSECRHAD